MAYCCGVTIYPAELNVHGDKRNVQLRYLLSPQSRAICVSTEDAACRRKLSREGRGRWGRERLLARRRHCRSFHKCIRYRKNEVFCPSAHSFTARLGLVLSWPTLSLPHFPQCSSLFLFSHFFLTLPFHVLNLILTSFSSNIHGSQPCSPHALHTYSNPIQQ